MIIKANTLQAVNNRTDYGLGKLKTKMEHFVVRLTMPANPFGPHQHDGEEFWFMLEGEGIVSIDGQETPVEAGDLAVLASWSNHGLRTDKSVRWICFG